jgi:hypothetical protein
VRALSRGAFLGSAVLIAAIGIAHADDAYNLPAVGAQLTYRLMSTTKLSDQTITAGQVYTYTITAVSGATSEGTIRPVALLYGCSDGDTRKDCVVAGKISGAKRDGDLLTIPVPDDIADALVKQSGYKGRYFLVEDRTFPMPGPKNSDDPNNAEFADTPLFILSNQLKCDFATLPSFFPLGKTPELTLSCHNIFSRTHSRVAGQTDQTVEEPISVTLSSIGADKKSLPSGEWDVQKVAIKYVPDDPARPSAEGESDVAVKLGVTVMSHSLVVNKATNLTAESTSELIAYKP